VCVGCGARKGPGAHCQIAARSCGAYRPVCKIYELGRAGLAAQSEAVAPQSSGAVVRRTPAGARRTASTLHGALQARHAALQQPVGHCRISPSFHPFLSSAPPPRPARGGTVRLAAQTRRTSAALRRSRHWRALQAARRGYRLSGDAWVFSALPGPLARPFSSGWASRLVTPVAELRTSRITGYRSVPQR
jgi:hypothetical protein